MLVHSLLVESIDLRRLGGAAGGNDVLSDRFDRRQFAPGEKNLRPLACEGACGAADVASGTVDHCNFVLQHHVRFLSVLSVNVRIVNDVDTRTPGKWAPTNRPVRPSAGVYTEWKNDKDAGRR